MITPIFYADVESGLFVTGDTNPFNKNQIIPDLIFPDNP